MKLTFNSATIPPYSSNSENIPSALVLETKHRLQNSHSEPLPCWGHGGGECYFGWGIDVAGIWLLTNIWSPSYDHLEELCFLTQLNLGLTIVFGLAKKMWMEVTCDTPDGTFGPSSFPQAVVTINGPGRHGSVTLSSRVRLIRVPSIARRTHSRREKHTFVVCW